MPKELVSTGRPWSDEEKAALYLSIIQGYGGPIPWDKVAIPEGRSVKAARCMLDMTKKQVRTAATAASGSSAPVSPEKSKKSRKPTIPTTQSKAAGKKETAVKRKRAAPKKTKGRKIKEESESEGGFTAEQAEDADSEAEVEDLILAGRDSKKLKTDDASTNKTVKTKATEKTEEAMKVAKTEMTYPDDTMGEASPFASSVVSPGLSGIASPIKKELVDA